MHVCVPSCIPQIPFIACGESGSTLGSEPMGQRACSHDVYGAGMTRAMEDTQQSKRETVAGSGWYLIWVARKSGQMTPGQGTE